MSRDTYHELIVKHYPRSISVAAAMIGVEAGRSVFITSEYTLMDLLSIIPFVKANTISKVSGSSTSVNISTGVI
jgi:hypothetical protein